MNLHAYTDRRWSLWHLIASLVMVSLGVAVTFDAWADIYRIASVDEEYSHIFLVPIVAAWLVWVRRARLRFTTPAGVTVGPFVALAGWGLSAYGFYHNIQSFWHAGAVIAVVGCALSVIGKNVVFRFFPAFAVLVFLVPVPATLRQQIAIPLQSWTAQIGQVLLELIGVETVRSGNQLSINGIPVAIAEACNGLRMVFALILVSYAFSFGLPLRNSVRFFVLLASPLAAIGCNVIRIVPTVWMYGYHSKDFAEKFHDVSGWLMLPISFAILYGIIQLLKWAMIPVTRYTLASQA